MDEASAPRGRTEQWDSWGGALRVVLGPSLLRRTLVIAVVVGTVLSLINQVHVIGSGDAGLGTWIRVAANFVVPFIVSSLGALAATRAPRA